MVLQAVLLILLLTTAWDVRGEPPGQITTGAVIHFGEDSAAQYAKVIWCIGILKLLNFL
jgi:hypothetical protein